jgi:hypothetical protein
MRRGFVKLWRASADNSLYFAEEFDKFHAWTDLLLLANFKPKDAKIKRGIIIHIKAGQILAGEEFLADRWGWSRGKVRRFLKYLSSPTVQQIALHKDNVCTVITVLNWNAYQGDGTADGTPNRTADGQQTDIPKNVKNVNNEIIPGSPGDIGVSKRHWVLHSPEEACHVDLTDELSVFRSDPISLACTLCNEFPDKSGRSGGGMGAVTIKLKTLARHFGGGNSGDIKACEAFHDMLYKYLSEIKSGEEPRNRGKVLSARVSKLLEAHGCP